MAYCVQLVLVSNFKTLKFVTLTAMTWTVQTYRLLARMPWLDRVTISVEMILDPTEAYWLQCISPQCFQAHLLCDYAGMLMWKVWQHGKLPFHELALYGAEFTSLQHLPQLHTLTIVDCPSHPGRTQAPLSNVTSLEFVGRFAIQQSQGLLHIVKSDMPSLKRLAFSASTQGCKDTAPMTTEALNACSFGRNLELIDLRGVNGLTTDKVSYLVSKIRKQQALGNARPEVQILLPSAKLSKAEPVLTLCYDSPDSNLLLPLFHKMASSENNKLVKLIVSVQGLVLSCKCYNMHGSGKCF